MSKRLQRAVGLIEEAILRKEIQVIDGAYGVGYMSGWFFLTGDCGCPIGIFLVNDGNPGHSRHHHCSDIVCAAADLLGVRKEWVAEFVAGFDGMAPRRIRSHGYRTGQEFRSRYLMPTGDMSL